MKLIVKTGDRQAEVRLERHGSSYRVELGERRYDVDVAFSPPLLSLLVEGRQAELAVLADRPGAQPGRYRVSTATGSFEVTVSDPLGALADAGPGGRSGGGAQLHTAYMPGRVVALLVAEGDEVKAGQGVLVLEAMKMENEIQAERDGVVQRLLVSTGEAVEGGDPLFEIG